MTPACLAMVCQIVLVPPQPAPITFTIVPEPTVLHLESICADYTKARLHREGLFSWMECR